MEYEIIRKTEVTSTNILLKQLAKDGADHGTVLVADSQTNGKGRMGRSFYSPKDTGIYMSILLREDFGNNPTLVTTLTAVAVMKAIEKVTSKQTQVKWVNDILLDGKKVCGILSEGSFSGKELEYMIVGIGVNVDTDYFPDDIKDIAGSVGGKKEELITAILDSFFDEYQNLSDRSYLNYYRERCVTVGKNIKIISPEKEPIEAFSQGITDDAGLIVKYPDGKTEVIMSGEVSVR